MRVPNFLLRDRVTLERYAGSGSHGETWGASEPNLRAHVEPKRRRINSIDGATSFADATAWFRPEVGIIPIESRVEWPTGSAAWYRVVHAGALPDEVRPAYRELIMERTD